MTMRTSSDHCVEDTVERASAQRIVETNCADGRSRRGKKLFVSCIRSPRSRAQAAATRGRLSTQVQENERRASRGAVPVASAMQVSVRDDRSRRVHSARAGLRLHGARLGGARAPDLTSRQIVGRLGVVGCLARGFAGRPPHRVLHFDRRFARALLLEIAQRARAVARTAIGRATTGERRVYADVAPRFARLFRLLRLRSLHLVSRLFGSGCHEKRC